MSNYKTVPNQKEIKVVKEPCDKSHYYATINLAAMEQAAIALDAPVFKLWIYFAKNQNGYEFALSSKNVNDTFGMKKGQYDRAIEKLIESGYLVNTSGNKYTFNEIPVVAKQYNETSKNKSLLQNNTTPLLQNNTTALLQNDTRNTTKNTTINTTVGGGSGFAATLPIQEEKAIEITIEPPVAAPVMKKQEKKELWRF